MCQMAWQRRKQTGGCVEDVTSIVVNLKELVKRYKIAKSSNAGKPVPFHVPAKCL